MAERTARLGSMHYMDADGQYRTALGGETIQVHPDFVDRFDRFNVLLGGNPVEEDEKPAEVPADKPAPKRRGRPRKETAE